MIDPFFLSVEDILFIHEQEIQKAGGDSGIRDEQTIYACVEAPKASFDGNKRTALASSLTFLYLNGYEVHESHDLELADIILDLLAKNILKEDVAKHLRKNARIR